MATLTVHKSGLSRSTIGIDSDGTNLYAMQGAISKINIADPNASSNSNNYASVNDGGYSITYYNGYLYYGTFGGKIKKINISNGVVTDFFTISGGGFDVHIVSMTAHNDYIYVGVYNWKVHKINLIGTPTSTTVVVSTPYSLKVDKDTNILYVGSSGSVYYIDINLFTTANLLLKVKSTYNGAIYGLAISRGYLFVSLENIHTLAYVNLSNNNDKNDSWIVDSDKLREVCDLVIVNNILYAGNFGNNSIVKVTNIPYAIPCFKEDSKILTDKGYLPIQDLKKGDLVQTLKHGFVPIHLIGKKVIYHSASQERIRNQLYKYDQNAYPEVFEDLVLTGCHSVLVDNFVSEEQRQQTIHVNGDTYVTDDKYRLPACADDKAMVYEPAGNYTIYHFALENEDYYMNYGVYANGLLVETTSIRFLKELSDFSFLKYID